MSEIISISEASSDDDLCDGLDCFAKATENIRIRLSKADIISLSLCISCVAKFREG